MLKKGVVVVFAAFFFIGAASLAKAVTVGPAKIQINANPGQVVTSTIFLKNDGMQSLTFYSSAETFTEQNGVKNFFQGNNDLSSWLSIPTSITLGPGGQESIPFSINVPKQASPGGHFAVVWWSTGNQKSNSSLSIITRAGVLVYLNVSGKVKESGDFNISGSLLSIAAPVNFNAVFSNTGNVALTPQGNLIIKNIFGGVVATIPFNQNGMIVLPRSYNDFSLIWQDGGFYFGPYLATLSANYGGAGKIVENRWFFVISWSVITVLIAITILAFLLPLLIRRYNSWIIKKAKDVRTEKTDDGKDKVSARRKKTNQSRATSKPISRSKQGKSKSVARNNRNTQKKA